MRTHFRNLSILLISVIIFSGCATVSGARFASNKNIEPGKAQLIFYRPDEFIGSNVNLTISEGEEELFKISNGQFVIYLTEPSVKTYTPSTFILGTSKPIKLDIKEGETYYFRLGIRTHFSTNTTYLSRVYEDEALEELKTCCKSGK